MSSTRAFPLLRAVDRLRAEHFDLLVMGGGIYGAWTACDAAQRGLRVALIEARDWAAGTSSASSKLIHGGLRYLENFEFGLVRESLRERRTLARIAPHHVHGLRFVLPVWEGGVANRLKLAAGLATYDVLAGLDPPAGRHRHLESARLKREFPWLNQQDVKGAFSYGDCQHDDARTTLTVVAAAQAAGAACANRITAETLLEDAGRIIGARLHDTETDTHFELRAPAVVAATGPWSAAFAAGAADEIERIRGIHLILPAIPGCDHAFILSAPRDGRAFFVIPWYGRSLVGTTESTVSAQDFNTPANTHASAAETAYLLDALHARLPGLGWAAQDVIASFAGARTLRRAPSQNLSDVSRDFDLLAPKPGLWLPLGGKFTTARAESERIVDAVCAALKAPRHPCITATTPLPGAPDGDDYAAWESAQLGALRHMTMARLNPFVAASLLHRYGTRVTDVIARITDDPRLAARLHPELPFIAAETVIARHDEMARSPDDVYRRRVPLTILARDGEWMKGSSER
ncbi:MAG: glycerol-3-phosphate dehydrogenase/oxidase [Nevskiaceae bacterium]|nr:MAG: glycerol-3-phosphate dehydrogenase/oxidase [Nevskiaceae bacterium]TBR71993.1 MAG: glycerol-3-phosphate dehydrogenase/oxidase [Nevskiaceae bacterium]